MKEYIWFDLGYTLLYLNREKAYRQALSEMDWNIDLDVIERAFHFTDKLFMREYPGCFGGPPEYYMLWYIGRLNYYLGVKADLYALKTRWMELRSMQERQWEAYDFCYDTLEHLKEKGFNLGVISNWDASARPILEELKLIKFFDTIVISSEVGVEKPDPGIFKAAFELSGSDAEKGIYFGDNYYDDAVGSRSVGMDCCIINRYGRFGVEEIDDCKVIPDIRGVLSCVEAAE